MILKIKCNAFVLGWYGYCKCELGKIRYFESIIGVLHWWYQIISNYLKDIVSYQINPKHMHYLDDGNAQVDQINWIIF